MQRLPVEATFSEFVESFGGELVEKLLAPKTSQKRADYLFRNPPVVAELKCLERDAFTPEYIQKLQALIQKWSAQKNYRRLRKNNS